MVELAQVSALLEKMILPTIQNQLYNKKILMKYFNKDNAGLTFNNDKIAITAEVSGHSGVGFTGATGGIATGKNAYSQMEVSAKYGFGSHIIWDSAMQAVKGKPGALINLVKALGTALEDEFQKSINRQLYGDGKGTLTTVTTGGTTTATHAVGDTRHLRVGQVLQVGTRAEIEAGTADVVTVSTINSKTSVTFTAAITTATNDIIVTNGIYVGGAYQEIVGLKALVSNNTIDSGSSFQGITRATNDWTNSYVEATTAVLTETQIIDALSTVNEFGDVDLIITTPTLRNKYASLLQSQRRQANTVDLKGGFVGLEVSAGDRPVVMVADYDCPAGEMFFLDTTTFSLAQLNPLEYLKDGSGAILTNVYDSSGARIPAYQATMKFYGNLVCTKPRANGRLTNKTRA